jgi:hypothetical protein
LALELTPRIEELLEVFEVASHLGQCSRRLELAKCAQGFSHLALPVPAQLVLNLRSHPQRDLAIVDGHVQLTELLEVLLGKAEEREIARLSHF